MTGFGRNSGGSVSIEFALIAPVFALAALAASDIAFAVGDAFSIDQALRNGSEAALDDPGEASVLAVLQNEELDPVAWSAERLCGCREAPDVPVTCSTTCAGPSETFIYYALGGSRSRQGVVLPAITLNRSAMVQVR